ncbi:ATP-dependent DNA ligase [Candidatus Babeliales bacterium]|nr:ATP-dependent DNA ligase [Candidatus Babeliales bacterium]MCF7899245.1 ATP-dependent DNA ligase [Candidatus Babeliales bacterium]
MKFIDVALKFNEIEKESSRLKMTELLADLFKESTPNEAAIISYLSLGELNPSYIGTQFNFASKSMIKVLAKFLDKSESTIAAKEKKIGDFGLILEEYTWEKENEESLTLLQVSKSLQEFLEISGTGSQEEKEKYLLNLLKNLETVSAKYVVRIILGKLRLGFSDMTLLDAFSWSQTGDKSLRSDLEEAYNICVDIGLIIKILKSDGIQAIKKINITPGIPIRPAAAERLDNAKDIVKKLGKCVVQPKLDGFRIQVHVDKTGSKNLIRFFSRNLQDMSQMFPDLKKEVSKLKVDNLVAEGEAIAYDVHTGTFLPFQETVKRKRKYGIEQMAKDFPLKLYLFDILFLNDKSLLNLGHEKRRSFLLKTIESLPKEDDPSILAISEQEIENANQLEEYFEQNVSDGLEGVVVKKIDSVYQAGKRNFNWIKLKRQETGELKDTIDCVILGYYAGAGKRASFGIGAFLVGVYDKDNDCFDTVAKIGTGMSDSEWKELKIKCDQIKVLNKPKNVKCSKELYPYVWTNPEIMCIVRADEITLSPLHTAGKTKDKPGMALRFPRFIEYRTDKNPEQATSVEELKELYHLQFKDKKHKKIKEHDVKNKNLNIFG